MLKVGRYKYEHLFIDNCSTDNTVAILRRIASCDHNVKVIVNARNFGHIRSPHHALLQTVGDAVISIVADLQDPPELIPTLIEKWEEGYPLVLCIKETSQENSIAFWLRKRYYRLVQQLSSIETIENFTGFGLFDRKVVELVRQMKDPHPFFRGMLAEIGLPYYAVPFEQPRRVRGITKNNFYTLYDMAMLGITNLSKVPLRVVTFTGFASALVSLLAGIGYLIYKLIYWNSFSVGIAPLVIGVFFFASVQLVAMGILGEYIGSIHTHVQNRPYAIERERINFEYKPGEPYPEDVRASAAVATSL
jgi:polyisoprenyl-phosphate glycosyltransferase